MAKFGDAQVFAVARAVIEPEVAGELLIAIDGLGEAGADGLVAQGGEEGVVYVGRGLGKVESDQRVVGVVPHGIASLAASLDDGVGQRRAAVGNDIVGGLLRVRLGPVGGNADNLFRLARQE